MRRVADFCFRPNVESNLLKLIRCAAVASLLCISASTARAQYRFDHFTNKNGLPQNTVSAITQTADGYLWFATYDGLVRYDGVRFSIFDKGNTTGLLTNQFLSLWGDDKGTLWAGTGDGGLVRYRKGVFTSFFTEHGLPRKLLGRLQPAFDGSLVVFIDVGENNFLRWTADDSLEAVNIFRWTENNSLGALDQRQMSEYVGRSQTRWIIKPGRLIRVKDGRETSFPTALTADDFFRFCYEDRAGNLWIGTRGRGLYCVAGDTLRHYAEAEGVPLNMTIKVAGEDTEGNLWLFTEKELLRYREGRFTHYSGKELLKSDRIKAAYCDREGTLWVGTNENGLFRLTRQFLKAYSKADGLLTEIVYPICQDPSGNIWLGSGAGLIRFAEGRFTAYPLGAVKSNSSSEKKNPDVGALYADRDGSLWIGSSLGLMRLKDGRVSFHPYSVPVINAILRDREGNLWMGGINELSKERDGVVTSYTVKDGLPDHQITALFEDTRGNLWAGTRGGLARREGEKFVAFTTKDGLVGNRIRCLYEDRDGALWIGTFDSGLSRLKDGRFTNYTTREGLFSNGVFQILEDRRGNFWISCNRGIYRVSRQQLNDYADGRLKVVSSVGYGIEDGMLSTECNGERQPAGIRARDGKLWFPTWDGVVVIDPELVPYNYQPPLVSIESVTLNGKTVGFEEGITLEPGQTDLEISFSAPGSFKADYVQFRFKLVGADDHWIEAGRQRTVRYSHLPPGNYTFKVIAANSDGVWNETGAALEIYKKPFFYQTRWFFALCVAAAMAVAASIYALRVHRLKVNERRLTLLVDERTAQLRERTQQLESANDKLEKLATLDGLTGIANRRRFEEFLSQEWHRSIRTRTPLSALLMDVDHFKKYNDTYGHQAGDECLKSVAAVLSDVVRRANDLAARYGGEEFVVILTDTDEEGAMVVAETIRARIESLQIPHSQSSYQRVTVSVGIATAVAEIETDTNELIAAADRSLYRSKEGGRNRCSRESMDVSNTIGSH
jgi:diguanylate cyclase (GGDEF)-like protein